MKPQNRVPHVSLLFARHGDFDSSQVTSPRLLINPHHVPARVAKPRRNLRSIPADSLHNLSAVRDNHLNRHIRVLHPEIHHQSWHRCRRTPRHKSAAHFPDTVVKRSRPIPALPDLPAKHVFVEVGRARNIGRRNLQVADLAVSERGRHECLPFYPALRNFVPDSESSPDPSNPTPPRRKLSH